MPTPIVNGQRGAYAQPSKFGRRQDGAYTIKRYAGTLREIYALIPALEQSGGLWEIEESVTGANHRIEAEFPIDFNTTEVPVESWEFFAQEVEKELLEADVAIVNGLTENEKDGLSQYMTDPGPDTTPAREPDSDYDRLFKQVQRGVKAARILVPTLRHTQTVSKNWLVASAFTNVGRLISTASLVTLESIPNTLLFPLPTNSTTIPDAAYSWFKKYPTVRVAAGHRIQIEQEWEYNLWSTLLYGNAL